MLNEEIIAKYVWNQNVYGALMSGNISANFINADKRKATEIIKNMIHENDSNLIDSLLKIDNWRAKVVAGCLIGFQNETKYIPQIGELFLNGCGGVTAYCYSFARFADDQSVNYLKSYLNRHLKFEKFPEEKFQNWAFSSLRWIDKVRNSNFSDEYLGNDGLWTKFVNYEFRNYKLSDSERWDIKKADIHFEKMMIFYKDNFEKNKS